MEADFGFGACASGQMQVNSELRSLLKQNREMVGATVQQARIYGSSRNFMAAVPESREMLERIETRAVEGNDSVIEINTIGKPMGGKTHELGQRIAHGRFNSAFLRRCLEVGKRVGAWGVNTTLVAENLRKLKDYKGDPLVWHEDASEWVDVEKARIARGMFLTVSRGPKELPRIHPEYDLNFLDAEWLVAILDEKGVPQFRGISFNQFRLHNPEVVPDAAYQRTAFRQGEKPADAYAKSGGEIDKDVSGTLLRRRQGSPKSYAIQEEALIKKYRSAHERLIKRGVPEFGDEELQDERFRDDVLLPAYYRVLMDEWEVIEGVDGVIVPNTRLSGKRSRRRRYFAHLIETFAVNTNEFYDRSEILTAA